MENENKITGEVTFFNDGRGYGFCRGDDGASYFIHYSAIIAPQGVRRKTLFEGDRVSFNVKNHERGTLAVNVQPLDDKTKEVQGV